MGKGKGVIQFTITYCEDGSLDMDMLVKNLSVKALDALVHEGYVTAKFALEMITKSTNLKGEHIQ